MFGRCECKKRHEFVKNLLCEKCVNQLIEMNGGHQFDKSKPPFVSITDHFLLFYLDWNIKVQKDALKSVTSSHDNALIE